jgi:hypothetical protein
VTDNVVHFPGTTVVEGDKPDVTPETIMEAAKDRYSELIMIGRNKLTNTYECVSTIDIPETLYHITRIHHRLNLHLDGG